MAVVIKHPLQFEWDESKNVSNIHKHAISFDNAVHVFEGLHFVYPSSHNKELRHVAVGEVVGKIFAVIFTVRHEKVRIISARRAHKKEEVAYRQLFVGQSPRIKH